MSNRKHEKMVTRVQDRAAVLLAHQNLKMARSAHAYVRGNTRQFYQWLKAQPAGSIPEGPQIWICGDCHTGNMGPVSDDQGRVQILIRDFDQSVIGNPCHDLIRLGLSLAMAARGSDLPGVTTARMLEALKEGYESAFPEVDEPYPELPSSVKLIMKRAMQRGWKHLARERIGSAAPTIPLNKRFWPLSAKERKEIGVLLDNTAMTDVVVSHVDPASPATVELVDAAYWRKGCSSLGDLRYAALMRVTGKDVAGAGLSLIDIKEARRSVAIRAPGQRMPKDDAERIVQAARHLSPALGNRMHAAHLLERSVVVRELMPQDMKLDIEHLSRKQATTVAKFLGMVLGRAHCRQMDVNTRNAWRKQLQRDHTTRSLDAPTWLWTSVTRLAAEHELTYLEHCRKFALADAKAA
jgi:uncharacterized protein (DUF2252 family)